MKNPEKFVSEVLKMAKAEGLNCFVVTDGASGIINNGSDVVQNAKFAQRQWEISQGPRIQRTYILKEKGYSIWK